MKYWKILIKIDLRSQIQTFSSTNRSAVEDVKLDIH